MLEKDKRRRELLVETEGLKQKRNEVSAEIANAKRNKQDATDAIKEMREVGAKIKSLDEELEEVEATVKDMASRLPNLPNPTIPVGPDESANVELRKVGTPREFNFEPKAHWDIGEDLGILDFDRGAKVSGARFVYYKGLGARLERAVYNFMLDEHAKEGYTEMLPPYIDQNYRTKKTRRNTFIGGSSCGGLMALYAAYAYSNIYSKAIVISPYVLESMDAILIDISQRNIQKNTFIYLSWGSNETSVMHEFVWQTKACTEIGNSLSKKGVKVLYNVIPEGRHCEEDWEKECDTFLPFLIQ